MSSNILKEIIEKRQNDINQLGLDFACQIPESRKRKIHPFINEKGVILEIKRASPSKGDIAPNLDAAATAYEYTKANAKAISCLTEKNYFKGSLNDFVEVANTLDKLEKDGYEIPALLRKDFLLSTEEIDISFKAGADAVLLIARILEKDIMLDMAKRCASHGMSMLIEIRENKDLAKLKAIADEIDHKYIVAGVNARDLKDFSIDLLTPAALLSSIKEILGENARVVFESGIRTAQAASFAGSLGFIAMLLGEAAAKKPKDAVNLVNAFVNAKQNKNSKQWLSYASMLQSKKEKGITRPFIKVCGITNKEDALKAAELGADFLGFIFCKESKRAIQALNMPEIVASLEREGFRNKVKLVAVITETNSEEAQLAYDMLAGGAIDFIQLHSCGKSIENGQFDSSIPHYAAVNINCEEDLKDIDGLQLLGEARILIDAKVANQTGGTGVRIEKRLVEKVAKKTKLWLAGGITACNVAEIIQELKPELIDIATGIEEKAGKKDFSKMEMFFDNIKKVTGER
ncbi:MAG: bifunctional indole-3-glycerol phosphate synthase/phosphoribosylanthranilate isomerase [Treponema sp.]|nr:bifunctional indole-3-glycerol phosphate synthase/phosphoribosylanthranilate isomerase [Treponema sp.]